MAVRNDYRNCFTLGFVIIQHICIPARVKITIGQISIQQLGETGVGKSFWINALANYLSSTSLEATLATDLISVKWSGVNECHDRGSSATRFPRSYIFKTEHIIVSIVDTPGIGSAEGFEQDKINFQIIFNYISNLESIHGPYILLNSNWLNLSFGYCFKELLQNLTRDVSQHIVFRFFVSKDPMIHCANSQKYWKSRQ